MTEPNALLALAERIEALSEGDRDIDATIEDTLGELAEYPGAHLLVSHQGRQAYLRSVAPAFTSDAGCALALAERLLPNAGFRTSDDLQGDSRRAIATIVEQFNTHEYVKWGLGYGPTLSGRVARAVTSAVLRAMAAKSDDG